MPIAFLCDFDGTVSPTDVGAAFVERFSPGRASELGALLEAWLDGRMGHRELTLRQCELLSVGESEALAFTARHRLDPHFAPFVREASGRGDAVMVVSEGFEFYLQPLLAAAGLGALPWAANRARFHADRRVTAEFPFADPACDQCGNCKAQHVRRYRALGYHTVMVGDGTSDRHGAAAADRIYARGGLAAWCEAEGLEFRAFENFRDVAEYARRLDRDLAAAFRRET